MTTEGLRSRVSWDRRGEITLTYDNAEAKWQLAELKKFDRRRRNWSTTPLAEDEEVDQDALGKLRNGLDDLLIVDVARKPDGLSADLKAGEDFLKNEEAFEDLIEKGFSPVAISGSEPEILSSEGEIVCTLRDGVEYVLRFGQLQVQTETAEEAKRLRPRSQQPLSRRLPTRPPRPTRRRLCRRLLRRRRQSRRRQEGRRKPSPLPVCHGAVQQRRHREAQAQRTA